MWEFLEYCLLCFMMIISAGFGHNPAGITFKNVIVGVITMFILEALLLGGLWLISVIVNKFRSWHKED